MKKGPNLQEPLAAWNKIPSRVRTSVRGLSESELNLRGGSEGWSIRETIHHLVEANLVASNIIVAALATDGCDYDWTWVNPNKSWMRRVGYDTANVDFAIKTLHALCRHISALVAAQPRALTRTVRLNDSPGAPRYVMTVEKILRQEVAHANEHLGDIRDARRLHSR
jgi:hypothetical protein